MAEAKSLLARIESKNPDAVMTSYPLELALILLITLMFCLACLISEIACALLNPRIRVGGRQ